MDTDDPRFRIAVAGRILEREGCASAVGGQISVRNPEGDGFYAVGFDRLDRVVPDEVALLGDDLTVRSGSIRLAPALGAHALVYRRRADVHAVIHLHAHHLAVLSTTGRTVGAYHVSAALFSGEQVVHVDDGTGPHTAVVDTLGGHRVAIMKNHGALVASDSLEHAVIEAIALESCARIHLESEAVGGTEIAPAEIEAGRRNFRPHYLAHMWETEYERTRELEPALFD